MSTENEIIKPGIDTCNKCRGEGVIRQHGTRRIKRVCECSAGRELLSALHDVRTRALSGATEAVSDPVLTQAGKDRVEDQFLDIGSIAMRRDTVGRYVAKVYLVDLDMRLSEDDAEKLSVAARFAVGEAIGRLKGF